MNQPLKTLLLAALGALPGILLLVFVGPQAKSFLPAFIIVLVLGALIGGLLSLPSVSGGNVLKGLATILVASNTRGGSRLLENLGDDSQGKKSAEPILKNNRFTRAEVPRSLDAIKQQHVFSVETTSGSLDEQQRASAVVIESVAPFSLAAAMELQPGDLLCKVDEFNAGDIMWSSLRDPAADFTYFFHRPAEGRTWKVVASGAPLGCEFSVTDEWLAQQVEGGATDFDDLQNLWRRGHWQWLERASRDHLDQADDDVHPPLEVLHGAALYEQGGVDEAIGYHRNYIDHHASGFVNSFRAIAAYYLGIDAFSRDDAQEGEAMLRLAYESWDVDRIANAFERHGCPRPRPDKPQWQGRKLPLDYELQSLERGKVSLADTLRSLEPHQVATLCLLGDYRANGPYRGFMRDFRRWYTFFPHFFPALHVITTNATEIPENESLLDEERAARAHGLPLHVLSDPDQAVSETVGIPFSPYMLMLDRHGEVLSEGHVDEAAHWSVIKTLITRPA